jgi:hypothetical protein
MPNEINPGSLAPAALSPANILDGWTNVAGTLLTIPAGRTWIGVISITASLVNAAGAAAASARPTISTAGAGVIPAAGTILGCDLSVAISAAAANGNQDSNSVSQRLVVIAPAGNAVTLTTAASTSTTASFAATGELQ